MTWNAEVERMIGVLDDQRPLCPSCAARVDRLQRSYGIVCAYPCCCWMSPTAAGVMVAERRRRIAAERAAA